MDVRQPNGLRQNRPNSNPGKVYCAREQGRPKQVDALYHAVMGSQLVTRPRKLADVCRHDPELWRELRSLPEQKRSAAGNPSSSSMFWEKLQEPHGWIPSTYGLQQLDLSVVAVHASILLMVAVVPSNLVMVILNGSL